MMTLATYITSSPVHRRTHWEINLFFLLHSLPNARIESHILYTKRKIVVTFGFSLSLNTSVLMKKIIYLP